MAATDNQKLYILQSEHWTEMHSCNGEMTLF